MSKNTSNELSTTVYSVPSGQEDVVSTICRIVSEDNPHTPQPMRGMKKANKVPTAAEQFSSEHHGEYEARGRQSNDRIGRVHRHNQACPKMYDELDKRRSVVAVVMKRKEAMELSGRMRRENKSKRPPRRNANAARRSRPQKSRTARNRVSKRRTHGGRVMSSNKLYRLSKIWKTKGCQTIGRSEFKNDPNWTRESMLEQPTPSQSVVTDISNRQGASEPSVSSYHSFYSTDHEPMDS